MNGAMQHPRNLSTTGDTEGTEVQSRRIFSSVSSVSSVVESFYCGGGVGLPNLAASIGTFG
jgi:hypothetical protein